MKILFKSNVVKGIACMLLAGAFMSCNFLTIDKYFDDEFKIDSAFTQKRYMEAYMWGAAALFPDEAQIIRENYTPGVFATDEGFCNFRVNGNVYYGLDFSAGLVTPEKYGNMNQWGTYYKIIRKCNNIIINLDAPADMTTSDRHHIEGYTRFIRAYAYYNILMDFGPPILLGDEVVATNEDLEYYDRARSTYDEAVEYICEEFEKAALLLPLTVSVVDFGLPTKGAAYGLIARIRLIHASPLYNGGYAARSYFGNWKRHTDDKYYISQEYDESRWAVAAAAAKRVMDMEDAGRPLYSLYTVIKDGNTPVLPAGVTSDPDFYGAYPDGATGIDPLKSYSDIFTGQAVSVVVPEFIWARKSTYQMNSQLNIGAFPVSLGGWGRFSVTQKVVDAYLMDDGRTIDEAKSDNYYREDGFTSQRKDFSGYTLGAGVYNMYENREMRFYASVGFCEAIWPNESSSENKNHVAMYYYGSVDGRDAASDPLNYAVTGYVIKKFTHASDAFKTTTASRTDKVFPILRYAEILLSYAEALNNLTQSHTVELYDGSTYTVSRNTDEIKNSFNLVRYRAGVPGLSTAQLSDASAVQAHIERERMVEFLWENRRYYDVRRWGIYEETEREPIMGMNTDGAKGIGQFYQRVIPSTSSIRGRLVDKKLVFLPIPRAEMRRLSSLDQNPGW